ncbi:hypothetical protein LguiA_022768 [Lonicera macranthoides]
MDGVDRRRALWKNLKQRLGFIKGCFCGSSWDHITAAPGMNLAAALEAERLNVVPTIERPGEQLKSLMRLFEETDGGDGEKKGKSEISDSLCCVCMERSKGAAFIPCGHTYCRVCSRELWLNRGCCPLCNRSIVEILDIF